MIGLLQRVSEASVRVNDEVIGKIDQGILVLLGIEKTDTKAEADRLLERLLNYRVFSDEEGKMNLSVRDINGELLLVPQFTLVADTHKGSRAGFSKAAPATQARKLFSYLLAQAHTQNTRVACGSFGVDMQVTLTNDGPVTFWLQV